MSNAWREINHFLGRFLSPAVRWIFVANLLIFIVMMLVTPFSESLARVFRLLMQTPNETVERFFIWQIVTYMFLHAGFLHLLMNMLVLWFFAPRLEWRWGTAKFLRFYLVAGVGAGLVNIVAAYLSRKTNTTMLGASGAIYGVLLAYALNWPNDRVLLYFVIPVKVKHLMILLGVFAFLGSIDSSGPGGISHVTHLGGLLAAFLWLKGGDILKRGRPGKRRSARVYQVPPNHPDFRA